MIMTTTSHTRPSWRKSSHSSGEANCVEVGQDGAGIAVRDSKHAEGPVLAVATGSWHEFTRQVKEAARPA